MVGEGRDEAPGVWRAVGLGDFGAEGGGGWGSLEAMKSQVSKILTFNLFINGYNYEKYH